MNRKEIIKELKNYINQSIRDNLFDSDMGFGDKSHYHELFKSVLELLESPLTLADLLGWEENVEYELKNRKFIILADNNLYELFNNNWYNCSFGFDKYKELQQATKVEPKLKAYHVKDEYSYNCLMKELEEQGYMWNSGKTPTKWNIKDSLFFFGWEIFITTDCEKRLFYGKDRVSSNYDLIEYHKEEPRYYAKIKGWELVANSSHIYWNRNDYGNSVFVNNISEPEGFTIKLTKAEWNKLGINDSNADFEKVED